MTALSQACKALSTAAHILEIAGYKRAEGLAKIKECVKASDIEGAEKAADALIEVIHEHHRAEQHFLFCLNACRDAWEKRDEEGQK